MMERVCLAVFTLIFSLQVHASTNLKEFFERCLPDCFRPPAAENLQLEQGPPDSEHEALLLDGADAPDDIVNACVVCQDAPSNTYNTACGHLGMCQGCAGQIKASANSRCPICRKDITHLKKVVLNVACALCNSAVPNTMNEGCGHLCLCNGCVDQQMATLERCPKCEQPITRYIELYLPDASF